MDRILAVLNRRDAGNGLGRFAAAGRAEAGGAGSANGEEDVEEVDIPMAAVLLEAVVQAVGNT